MIAYTQNRGEHAGRIRRGSTQHRSEKTCATSDPTIEDKNRTDQAAVLTQTHAYNISLTLLFSEATTAELPSPDQRQPAFIALSHSIQCTS